MTASAVIFIAPDSLIALEPLLATIELEDDQKIPATRLQGLAMPSHQPFKLSRPLHGEP